MPGQQRPTRGFGLLEGHLARRRMRLADRLIDPALRTGRLLDIGCGRFPLFLVRTRFAEKVGLDQHIDPADRPTGLADNITLRRHDLNTADRLPFDQASFHVVTMLAVFEHVRADRLVGLLDEIARVLLPGGQFIMTSPHRRAEPLLRWMARLRLVSPHEIDEHETCYDHPAIRRLIDASALGRGRYTCGTFEWGLNLWVMVRR